MADPLPITDTLILPADCLEVRASRSGGPGGQHANTADTRIQLWLDIDVCEVLRPEVKRRLCEQRAAWLTRDGRLLVASDANRSQHRNLEEVRERMAAAVRAALKPPKRRVKTKPSRAAKRRRVDAKKQRGATKRMRGRIKGE